MMEENRIRTNSPKAWLLAARPKTLSGAAVPVMIGVSLAYVDAKTYGDDVFSWMAAGLCLLFAFIMQIVSDPLFRRLSHDPGVKQGLFQFVRRFQQLAQLPGFFVHRLDRGLFEGFVLNGLPLPAPALLPAPGRQGGILDAGFFRQFFERQAFGHIPFFCFQLICF